MSLALESLTAAMTKGKIGPKEVLVELLQMGYPREEAARVLQNLIFSAKYERKAIAKAAAVKMKKGGILALVGMVLLIVTMALGVTPSFIIALAGVPTGIGLSAVVIGFMEKRKYGKESLPDGNL
ncbi:MAG: hypothetical protein GXP49_01060 [Deltaproteobacteria bacterium]|nr:hypothetical protein [Deltaproteobacteria bacterium]